MPDIPQWKSVSYAPGLIMANGITASQFDPTSPEIRPYTSSDAGLNWKRIETADGHKLVGPAEYEIAAHGSLLVAASYKTPTDHL